MECECVRAGSYVNFKFHDVSFEMVKTHNPCQHILVGGITLEEEAVGCIQGAMVQFRMLRSLTTEKDALICYLS